MTSPGHAKTTHKVKRRRPSRSNKDDLQGQTKTTFQVKQRRLYRSNEDDLHGPTKTTFMAKRRRASRPSKDDFSAKRRRPSRRNEDDLCGQTKTTFEAWRRRLPSIHKLERRPSLVRKTTFHSSHRLPIHFYSRLTKSDRARVCTPEAAPSSKTLPDQRDHVVRPLTKA